MDQNQQNGFFNPNETPNSGLNQQNNPEYNQVQQPQQQFNQPQQQFGTYQQANQQQLYPQGAPQFQEYQAPVYSGDFKPIKKKFNPLAVIIPAVILIAAAVVVFFIFFNKSSYEKSEKQFFSDFRSGVLSSVDETQGKINSESQSISFDVSIPDELSLYLGGISNAGFDIDAIGKDGGVYGSSNIYLGGSKMAFEYWLDSADQIAYMFFPEASDIYLKCDASENSLNSASTLRAEKNIDYNKLAEAFCDIIDETMKTYYEEIGDVKIEKNQEFTVEGDIYTADKAVIHLNAAQLAKIISAFRDNLLANEEALNLLVDACGLDSVDELKEEINDMIDKERFDSIIAGEDNNAALDMNVYMKNNQIVGREITITNDDMEEMYFDYFGLPTDGGEEIAYFSLSSSDEYDDIDVKFYLKNKEINNANNGTASLSVNGEAFNISYNDLAVDDDLFQGTITASMEGEAAFTANVVLKTEGETKTIVFKIPNICTITATVKPSDIQFKEFPSDSSKFAELTANGYNYDDPNLEQFGEDLSEYFQKFLEPILGGLTGGYDDDDYFAGGYYDYGEIDESFGGFAA